MRKVTKINNILNKIDIYFNENTNLFYWYDNGLREIDTKIYVIRIIVKSVFANI